jgi:hypothetical protein
MLMSGMIGGVFLAAMEGAGVLMGKMMGGNIDPQPIVLPEPMQKSQQKQQVQEQEPPQEQPTSLFKGKFGFGSL